MEKKGKGVNFSLRAGIMKESLDVAFTATEEYVYLIGFTSFYAGVTSCDFGNWVHVNYDASGLTPFPQKNKIFCKSCQVQ